MVSNCNWIISNYIPIPKWVINPLTKYLEGEPQYYPARARRSQYNKFLANYLASQDNDFNDDDLNQYRMSRKRSMFRERGT